MKKEELFEQIKQDNTEALKQLFNLYYPALCSYIAQFTKSFPEAEDIVQSVFIKLWTNRKRISIKDTVKSYLYKAAYNAYIDTFRAAKKEKTMLEHLKYKALEHQLKEDDVEQQEKIERIKNLINTLPERCKEIVLLSKKEGYKNREIAEKLGISIKTVEAQLRIAFQKIREGFRDESSFFLFFYFH